MKVLRGVLLLADGLIDILSCILSQQLQRSHRKEAIDDRDLAAAELSMQLYDAPSIEFL